MGNNTLRSVNTPSSLVLSACVLVGCPDDGNSSMSATEPGGTSADTTGTTAEELTGMASTDDIPPEACIEPPAPPAPIPVPQFDDPPNSEEVVSLDLLNSPCPKTFALFPDTVPNSIQALIYRPSSMGSFPPGLFPLILFSHGNGQFGDLYGDILEPLAQRGFIVASIVQDGNASPGGRRVRLLCLAEALLDENVMWSGLGRLDGSYALTGHSTGGAGAFSAAVTSVNNPNVLDGHHLASVAAIAPNAIPPEDQIALTLAGGAPPYFVLQGTGDGDTSGGAFSSYDRVLALMSGAKIFSASRKALVWAYNVEHNEYGGKNFVPCLATPKAISLTRTYWGGFLLASFYRDPQSLNLFFGVQPPAITPAVADPSFWQEFGGQPQIFGTSSQQADAIDSFKSYEIDGFSNGNVALSDGGLTVTSTRPDLYFEVDAAQFFDNFHIADVAAIQWMNGDSITWSLNTEARTELTAATSITFRAGVAVDVSDPVMCIGVSGELPELTLRVSDTINEAVLNLSPYGRLSLPEARSEVTCENQGDGCHAWDVMQTTFRIPLSDLCQQNPAILLSKIREISLQFSGADGVRGVILIDDVQVNTIPGEPPVACRCSL